MEFEFSNQAPVAQAEDLVFNDGVWGMLFYPVIYSMNHGWLKNYRPDSQISGEAKYYDLDLEAKKKLKPALD